MSATSADTELIGWALTSNEPVYHAVKDLNPGGSGVSRCGTNLAETGPPEAARSYERPCVDCFRPRKPPPIKRPLADVENEPERSRAPVQPKHVRVAPNGRLAVRIAGPRPVWVVLDPTTGTVTGEIADTTAKNYPTLRSLWPPIDLIGGRDLAAEFQVSLAAVSHMQARHDDFPEPNVRLGGRAGWFPERWPEFRRWYRNRTGRGGSRSS